MGQDCLLFLVGLDLTLQELTCGQTDLLVLTVDVGKGLGLICYEDPLYDRFVIMNLSVVLFSKLEGISKFWTYFGLWPQQFLH